MSDPWQTPGAPPSAHPPARTPGGMAMPEGAPPAKERKLWEGHPSQWSNFAVFVRHVSLALLVAAVGIVGYVRPEPRELFGAGFLPMLWVLALLAVAPLVRAGWKALQLATTHFEVTSERVRVRQGVLSRTWEEIELYRVKDATLHQPFLYRLVGLSSIVLMTSDRSHPVVVIPAIRDGETLREELRESVELQRQRRGVRELDT